MLDILNIKDITKNIQKLGRTFQNSDGELFFNWTCSGIRLRFKGSCLIAEFNALFGEEMDRNSFDGTTVSRKLWPCVAVFLDDAAEPVKYYEIDDSSRNYLLFSSEQQEEHIITIRKMTENPKGKLSISKFLTDGMIEKLEENKKKTKIEFIGDSITCGFGNLSNDRDRLFFSSDENGWMSHAAIAAKKLDAEFNIISFSGIAVTTGLGNFPCPIPSMVELYPYTDRLIEEQLGKKTSFRKWSFTEFKPDVIVLNLGTNDATVIDFNMEIEAGIKKFEEEYYQFLGMIRELNGTEPWIICTLGSMDYYLYDNILRVAEKFAAENNDNRISCFKYGRIRVLDGFGACGHPNIITQQRMGQEIAEYIQALLQA